jgi:hypothetical protein
LDTNSEFIGGGAGIDLSRKIGHGRDYIQFRNPGILVNFGGDELRLGFFAALPHYKHRLQFEELRDNRLERKLGGGMCRIRIIGLNSDGFYLCAGAAANVKGCSNFPFFTGGNFILLRLCCGATA